MSPYECGEDGSVLLSCGGGRDDRAAGPQVPAGLHRARGNGQFMEGNEALRGVECGWLDEWVGSGTASYLFLLFIFTTNHSAQMVVKAFLLVWGINWLISNLFNVAKKRAYALANHFYRVLNYVMHT